MSSAVEDKWKTESDLTVMFLIGAGLKPTVGKDGIFRPLNLGRTVMTIGIAEALEKKPEFIKEIERFLLKQRVGDFSGMEFKDDIKLNKEAFLTHDSRVLSDFESSMGKIWVITDQWENPEDNVTTVLFPEEY